MNECTYYRLIVQALSFVICIHGEKTWWNWKKKKKQNTTICDGSTNCA